VPVRKVPYQPGVADGAYDPDKHTACTLYGGTDVAQARAPGSSYPGMGLSAPAETGGVALAMVVRTRFYSAKGQLLRCVSRAFMVAMMRRLPATTAAWPSQSQARHVPQLGTSSCLGSGLDKPAQALATHTQQLGPRSSLHLAGGLT
jgi:hypothetical protein